MDASNEKCSKLRLSDQLMKSMVCTRAFKDSYTPLNSMDWDREGDLLITSSSDEFIQIYSVNTGDVHKTLHLRKDGAEIIRFAYQSTKQCVCVAKKSIDEQSSNIKLWDITENTYMQNFVIPGCVNKGVGLAMHPHRSMMLVSSTDCFIRLFFLDNSSPMVKIVSATKHPVAAFDTEGYVFACYLGHRSIHLYDCNNYSKGEFYVISLTSLLLTDEYVTSIVFSSNGSYMLLSTDRGQLLLLTASAGDYVRTFTADGLHTTSNPFNCYPSITPDSQYVLCGGEDNAVHIWRLNDGEHIHKLEGHAGAPRFAHFNPKKLLIASGSLNVAWWTPGSKAFEQTAAV